MNKDKDYIHWKLWRYSVDWFTDNSEWFLYLRYWKPNNDIKNYKYEVSEVRFSSAGFMASSYYCQDHLKH